MSQLPGRIRSRIPNVSKWQWLWGIGAILGVLALGSILSKFNMTDILGNQDFVYMSVGIALWIIGLSTLVTSVWPRRRHDQRVRWVALICAVFAFGVCYVWLDWEDLRKDQDSALAAFRNISLIIGSIIAVLVAIWRSTVAERQAETSEQSLLNERYQRGAEMLGSEVRAVRLGGIYALERLAVEYPGEYHIQVMNLLCAFVRNPTEDFGTEVMADRQFMLSSLRNDVQVAITVVGKRSRPGLDIEQATKNFRFDLSGADLSGGYLVGANLAGADLRSATLAGTNFMNADLSKAILAGATMSSQQPQDEDSLQAIQSRQLFRGVNVSCTRFSFGRIFPGIGAIGLYPATGMLQEQLDLACADPGKQPEIDGVVDAKTGKQLVWCGEPCDEDE